MKNILKKVINFIKTYKKRIIAIISIAAVTVIIAVGAVGGVVYSRAKTNIKYTEEQLKQIALKKVPGEVLEVEKELNLKKAVYEYKFKIKDKDNMLKSVEVDSKYGVIKGHRGHKGEYRKHR